MAHEKLTLKGFITEVRQAKESSEPKEFCFILGAGASKSSGIPLAKELVATWDQELWDQDQEAHEAWRNSLGITDRNRTDFYSKYYERRYHREPRRGYLALEQLMDNAMPSVGYIILADLITRTNNRVMITTNFDHLLERAINDYTTSMPLVIPHEDLAGYFTPNSRRPTILKLHRDLLLAPKNEAKELEQLDPNWKQVLGQIFARYYPIFIGYAGNDPSVMNFLTENADKFRYGGGWQCPYWMTYQKEVPNGRVMKFLDAADGYWVPTSGFDKFMVEFGEIFGYKFPDEETFLGGQRERHQNLRAAYNKLSDEISQEHQEDAEQAGRDLAFGEALQQIISQEEGPQEGQPDPEKLNLNGIALAEQGRFKEAEQEFREAIRLDPNYATPHNGLGNVLHYMGRYEEAEAAFRETIRLAFPLNGLSIALDDMGRYEEAEAAYREAIRLDPNYATPHNGLGNVLDDMGRYEEAEAAYREAIRLDPNFATPHYNLSLLLKELGRQEEAASEKQIAHELDPDNF